MRKRPLKPGQRLRAIRERLGFTLRDVYQASLDISSELGQHAFVVPPSRLYDFEMKKIIPNIHRLYTLARVYKCSMDEILSWYGIPPL